VVCVSMFACICIESMCVFNAYYLFVLMVLFNFKHVSYVC
jgi:hypothetical protein